MAVGIVMGGAVAAIVKSFLENIITPLIAMIFKVPDMSSLNYPIGQIKEIKDEAGAVISTEQAAIHYGTFIQNTLDFVILAFVIFIASESRQSMDEESRRRKAALGRSCFAN